MTWVATRNWPEIEGRWRSLQKTATSPQPAAPAAEGGSAAEPGAPITAASSSAAQPTLAERLHALEVELRDFAGDAAYSGELADHPKFAAGVTLLADAAVPLETVTGYAFGQGWLLSCMALAALVRRPECQSVGADVCDHVDIYSTWQLDFALQLLAKLSPQLPAGAPLVGYRDWWAGNPTLQHVFIRYFDRLGEGADASVPAALTVLDSAAITRIGDFLREIRHPLAKRIASNLEPARVAAATPDTSFLGGIGRFWAAPDKAPKVLDVDSWAENLRIAARTIELKPRRSILVTGETLVGKTSFLHLLAAELATSGWRIFEASGADLQAGQKYIGELEGRLRQLIEEIDADRKIIWYIPDLLQLALSGTHSGQSASMLDQIAPALSSGKIVIWSEASPQSAARLLQLRPSLRRQLEIVPMQPLDEDVTEKLGERLGRQLAATLKLTEEPGWTDAALDIALHYLSSNGLPGSALSLIRLTALAAEKANSRRVSRADVLTAVSQLTGLPRDILDGSERLDLASLKAFFEARVIGQPDAVACIVERIAMLKSGLVDPGKPIGTFLFAGPTGTGKTELAKATAEYLFGSDERMIRLDMSEYQSADQASKILGGYNQSPEIETLITRIRKQPFSLILLDEFEKSHPQIWDLFLQVFDEGRLTDGLGQTADFRHCLIILTTNLGATAHQGGGLGFAPSRSPFTSEQIMQAVGRTFRPEFQNRLDKVIVFQPLTRELMRGILKKELGRLFERRGLKDKDWAVEWEASALEFLLEKGFTADLGARPLKRAIDQYVAAPLAATIVERRFPEGDQFVFVRRDGQALSAEFVDPDADDEAWPAAAATASGELPSLTDVMRTANGETAEVQALALAHQKIAERIGTPEWEHSKAELAQRMSAPEFWTRKDRFETLSQLELMDRLETAADTATSLGERLRRSSENKPRSARELISRLALQLHLLEDGLIDMDGRAPVDVVVAVEPAMGAAEAGAASPAWCRDIRAMYEAWARKRNMRIDIVEDAGADTGPAFVVAGFGAFRTLSREAGLHVLEESDNASGAHRVTARVLVVPAPADGNSKSGLKAALRNALKAAPRANGVVRRYRRGASPLVRNADGSWRSGKLDEILGGDFDLYV